jgi:hypothetical protein
MKPAKLLILITCFAALALLAGCGGGGDDSTATETTQAEKKEVPTKAQLISEGDAICGEVNAAAGAAGAEEEEVGESTIKVADLYIGMVESIKALGEPQDAAGYDGFIEAADALLQAESDAKLAAEREETSLSGSATTALEEFQAEAAIYGFSDCAEEASAPTTVQPETGLEEEGGAEVEEGGIEVEPEFEEEVLPEEVAPEEEIAPEGGGAGVEEEVAPEGGGTEEGSSGGVGPG